MVKDQKDPSVLKGQRLSLSLQIKRMLCLMNNIIIMSFRENSQLKVKESRDFHAHYASSHTWMVLEKGWLIHGLDEETGIEAEEIYASIPKIITSPVISADRIITQVQTTISQRQSKKNFPKPGQSMLSKCHIWHLVVTVGWRGVVSRDTSTRVWSNEPIGLILWL